MNAGLLVALAVASLPAGWFAAVLVERVPPRQHLFKPFPGLDISRRHPIVHALVTLLFLAAGIRFGEAPPLVLFAYLVFFTGAVALGATDLAEMRLPDLIVIPMFLLSVPLITIASLANHDPEQIRTALTGAGVYFGFLLVAHLISPRGMAFGDVKMSGVMGLYVGWVAVDGLTATISTLYAMIVGFIIGAAVGIVLFAFRRKSRQYPFGPFLLFGAIVAILASPQLINASM